MFDIFCTKPIESWGLIVAGIAALKGLMEYSRANKIKKIELLNLLIAEFNENKMLLAKKILDDFAITDDEDENVTYSHLQGRNILHKTNLADILANHVDQPMSSKTMMDIRESFDFLLDFFSKLEYLLSLGLLNKRELFYFKYFLDKILTDDNVLQFCRTYEFHSIFRLAYIFKVDTREKVIWDSYITRFKGFRLRFNDFF